MRTLLTLLCAYFTYFTSGWSSAASHLDMEADLQKLVSAIAEATSTSVSRPQLRFKLSRSVSDLALIDRSASLSQAVHARRWSTRALMPWRLLSPQRELRPFAYIVYAPATAAAEGFVLRSILGQYTRREWCVSSFEQIAQSVILVG